MIVSLLIEFLVVPLRNGSSIGTLYCPFELGFCDCNAALEVASQRKQAWLLTAYYRFRMMPLFEISTQNSKDIYFTYKFEYCSS